MKDIILITGASSDLGSDLIARIDKPDTVILAHCHRSKDKLEKVCCGLSNAAFEILQYDLGSEPQIIEMINRIKKKYSAPAKIVHFAAPKVELLPFHKAEWELYQQNIDIQLKSIVLILKAFLPSMAKAKYGKLVFVLTSDVFDKPTKGLANYTGIKYALLGLMKSLAAEYAEKKININAVSPSMIETSFLQNIHEMVVAGNAANNPFKRNAVVGDITPAIKFLLSEEADYITGANIPITGGSVF